jgi:hypothetical protein
MNGGQIPVDINYFGSLETETEMYLTPEGKKYNDPWRYSIKEIDEFSKGNRDYITGYTSGNDGEIPIILSPKYKKNVKKDGTIIITDHSFDMRGNEKWKNRNNV